MQPGWPIETDRLTLRPYEEGGFDALHAMQSDARVVRWLYNEPRTAEETRALLERKIAGSEPRNAASARVLEKLGMRREAHLVENEWVKGEWQSELVYAVLEREWR
jgi:RimJ/RimL family protein N-acetyltransferase